MFKRVSDMCLICIKTVVCDMFLIWYVYLVSDRFSDMFVKQKVVWRCVALCKVLCMYQNFVEFCVVSESFFAELRACRAVQHGLQRGLPGEQDASAGREGTTHWSCSTNRTART